MRILEAFQSKKVESDEGESEETSSAEAVPDDNESDENGSDGTVPDGASSIDASTRVASGDGASREELASAEATVVEEDDDEIDDEDVENGRVSQKMARRILFTLMFPAVIMPSTGSMTRVALPIIRDDFNISADMTSWVSIGFMLPFMVLMPVYGRLSDVVGRKRLLLLGIFVFLIGTLMTVLSTGLGMLIAGRAVQGLGASGLMPLGMAFIAAIFSAKARGRAMGTWSQVGPFAGFVSPLIAGLIISAYGWRVAFAVPLLIAGIAITAIYLLIPSGLSTIEPGFLRHFDWMGVFFLAGTASSLIFYLSSRPITGYRPLTDWRLLLLAVLFGTLLVWWERRQESPFIPISAFRDRVFVSASTAASMRMVLMSAMGFLLPLYLVDVRGLSSAAVGTMLIIHPGAMTLMVRQGGQVADRWGSRLPVLIGLSGQGCVMILLYFLPGDISIWALVLVLMLHGLSSGLMLAPLHRSAMGDTPQSRMGAVAGNYNLVRFTGMACGTALSGVILQHFLDSSIPVLQAYQLTFICFLAAAVVGILLALTMREPKLSQQGASV